MRSWPNRKFAPTQTSATRSQSTSTVLDERFRIPARQLRREAHDRRALHAGRGDRLELLRLGHQQRRRLVGPDDARRMRIERHDDGRGAALAGDAAHAIEDLAMAAVHAVEVAEREHRLHPARRARVVGKVDDVHATRRSTRVHVEDTPNRTGLSGLVTTVMRSPVTNLQHQPIIGQLHAGGQARAGRGVRQVVADVREVGALGRRAARRRRAPRRR